VELIVQPDAHDVVHEMPVRGEWPANGVAKGNIAGGKEVASRSRMWLRSRGPRLHRHHHRSIGEGRRARDGGTP
jgi:hypothetical protein